MVETILGEDGLLRVLGGGLVTLLDARLGLGQETGLLLLLALGLVLVEKLEQLSSSVLVKGVRELGDGRGNLQALVEDDLLTLEADVFGPLDEAGQVTLGGDVAT